MKLTQQDQARLLGIDPRTLRKWRKEKPYLYKIIMQGFAIEETIKKAEENISELKEIAQSLNKKKEE